MGRKKKSVGGMFDGWINDIGYVRQIDDIVVDLFGVKPIDVDDLVNSFFQYDGKLDGMEKNLYMAIVFDRFKMKVKSKYKVKIKFDFDNEIVYVNGKSDIEEIKEELK